MQEFFVPKGAWRYGFELGTSDSKLAKAIFA
jgi:hypothetical protein